MPLIIIYILLVLLGLLTGALVNYLSDVLPHKRRLAHPFCLKCGKDIPASNYFFWPRRCPSCNARRHWRVWLVEAAYVAAAFWLWFAPSIDLGFYIGWIVLILFGVIVVIDMEYRLILHPVSIAGAVLALLFGSYLHGIPRTLIGGAVGFGVMFAFYFLGNQFIKLMGRLRGEPIDEDALGYGDVNLSGVLGLLIGWDKIIFALFFGIAIGAAVSLVYLVLKALLRKYTLFTAIPYGPFLIAGAMVILYF